MPYQSVADRTFYRVNTTLHLTIAGHIIVELDAVLAFDRVGRLICLDAEVPGTNGWFDALNDQPKLPSGSSQRLFCEALVSAAREWLLTDDGIAADADAMQCAIDDFVYAQRTREISINRYGHDFS